MRETTPRRAHRHCPLSALGPIPVFLWVLIVILASGLKTIPHLSDDEAWMGAIPALVMLPILLGPLAASRPLRLTARWIWPGLVGGVLCGLGLLLLVASYLNQPG